MFELSKYLKWVQVYLKWVFCLVVFCISTGLPAVAKTVSGVDLWPSVQILEDDKGILTSDTVITLKSQFTNTKKIPYANLGIRQGAVWLLIPIDATFEHSKDWVLTFGYPLLALAEVYHYHDGKLILRVDVGDEAKVLDGPTQSHNLNVPLSLGGQGHDILIRVSSEGSLLVPLRLTEASQELQIRSQSNLIQGMYAGVALGLWFFALAQLCIKRKLVYVAFAGLTISITLFMFTIQGMSAEHLWGSIPFLKKHAAHILILSYIGCSLWFISASLQLRNVAPKLAKIIFWIKCLSFFIVLLIIANLLPFRITHTLANILGVLSVVSVLGALWYRARHGVKIVWLIFAGWAIFTSGSIMLAGMFLGAISYSQNIFNYFQISSLFEIFSWLIVLSIDAREKHKQNLDIAQVRLELTTLAETDSLTNLPNRRALMKRLDKIVSRSSQHSMCGVLALDLDKFKILNDQYGHTFGDQALKEVSNRLIQNLRSRDFICRLGGDEFIVLISGVQDSDFVREISEKLLKAFDADFVIQNQKIKIGITIGYAIAPLDGINPDGLLDLADKALYLGKRNGGNLAVKAISNSSLQS